MQLYFRSFIVLSCLSTLSVAYAWDYAAHLTEQEGKRVKQSGSIRAYQVKEQKFDLKDNRKGKKNLTKLGQQQRRETHLSVKRGYGK